MWKKIRTANILERAFREMKMRMIGVFSLKTSVKRLTYGMVKKLNGDWDFKILQKNLI